MGRPSGSDLAQHDDGANSVWYLKAPLVSQAIPLSGCELDATVGRLTTTVNREDDRR
jgi:hypothetical protein